MTAAWAEAPHQTLDRVDSFNPTSVIEMQFHDPDRTQDFINLGITGTSITACKLTPVDGLYCLDGKIVRHWPDTSEPATSINEFSCGDAALQLASTNPCTSMTVGLSGAIYLAGRKSNSNNLIKVTAKPSGGCPSGSTSFAGGRYCAQVLYAGTAQLVDIESIDGDVGAAFKPCPSCAVGPGILGIGDKKTVTFFPVPATTPVGIATSQVLPISGNEQLLSGAVLQLPNGSATDSYVLLTTTTGQVLAKRVSASTGTFFQAYNVPGQRAAGSVQCNTDTQRYGIRTSTTTGHTYVTDRNYCQVKALAPVGSPLTSLAEDLTLATSSTSGTFPPSGPTLASGINVDLGDCVVDCTYLKDETGTEAAAFVAVKLNTGSATDATVFQILGIPDCRQKNNLAFPPDSKAICDAHPEAIVTPPGAPNDPAAQLLNVTALFPHEILDLFDASGVPPEGLPNLLISRQYIATSRTDFLFDAFFYVTEPGVQFKDTFTAEFDVPVLEGGAASLGCEPDPNDLIAWDIMTNVSERYRSTDINGDVSSFEYVDTLTNVGCRNPTKTLQKGISLIPYNLAINPNTYGPKITGVTDVTHGNDAVFARLTQNLYDDLEFVRKELACKTVDAASGQPPISSSVCNTLASRWANGKIKLDKCIAAAFKPKQSTADENCGAFASQLANYRAAIPATTPVRDIANRVGELKMRVDVISNLFTTRMLPSMTSAGFCREFGESNPSCPDPWQ